MHKNMHYKKIIIDIFAVTFREEGVDWNTHHREWWLSPVRSPSARKVWIEICLMIYQLKVGTVTFREEGVDWNRQTLMVLWLPLPVTFREEGVDWNSYGCAPGESDMCHLPRGRCGLKCKRCNLQYHLWNVTFREEGVDWNTLNALVRFVTPPSPSARKVWIEIQKQCIERLQSYVTFREEGVDWNSPLIAVRFG